MRAVWLPKYGDPDVLEVRETPDPEPKQGEIRIRVRAAGLNFAEVSARQGLYPDAPKPPCVLGYEVAGVVDALGEGATSRAIGDRVIAMTRFGGHADVVCVPEAQAMRLPAAVSFEEGAALPVNYLTAYHMLFRVACIRPRETILIHMAAGGVGIAAIQLAKTISGVTILGTASGSKHAAIRAEGCTHPIDYRQVDYEEEVRRHTDGRGVDIVLDALGGADNKKGYRLLRPAGRLVLFGMANAVPEERRNLWRATTSFLSQPLFTPMSLMNDNRMVAGVNVGHLWGETEMLRGHLDALMGLLERRAIAPRVDSTFRFDQAADAHRRLHERANIGKVILVP